MKKLLVTFFLLLITCPAYAGLGASLDVDTYYPSPYGAYETFRLFPKAAVGGTSCDIGTLYINADDNDLMYYCIMDIDADGEWINYAPGVWQDYNNNVYLTDITNPTAKSVGIGTSASTPIEFKLTLENDASILASGTFGSGYDLTTTGRGARFIWHAKKGAIRAGTVYGEYMSTGSTWLSQDAWNDNNVGDYSVGFGEDPSAYGTGSTVRGGIGNYVVGNFSTITGGAWSVINDFTHATILGGGANLINGNHSFIAGSTYNTNSADFSVITGNYNGRISDDGIAASPPGTPNGGSVITGGTGNILIGDYSVIGNGYFFTISGQYNTLGSGVSHVALTDYSTIGGGQQNRTYQPHTTIAGGYQNLAGSSSTATGSFATIGGGRQNINYADYSYLGGGHDNAIKENAASNEGDFSAIGGGYNNNITEDFAFIGGGKNNSASGLYGTIGGGDQNTVDASYSSVGGGFSNSISGGNYSTILGGSNNSISWCNNTFVGGYNMNAGRNCRNGFLWGHSGSAITLAPADQFIVYSGNVGIGTTSTSAKLHVNGNTRIDNGSVSITNIPTIGGASSPLLISPLNVVGYDIAEEFKTEHKVSSGDVLVINTTNPDKLIKSATPYDHRIIGVVSKSPAALLKSQKLEFTPGTFTDIEKDSVPVALAGRVLCNVSLENGDIKSGDLLTTSSIPGHAMKATEKEKSFGAIIGKALENFSNNDKTKKGQIVILINRQ